ncbi:MAG TPA: hypothetical protein VGQ83_42015 [Polyangia bacterium]|jgi:hypothetical protein
MTPDRIRRSSAIDLRLRLQKARTALCGMDALYDELGDLPLCTRLKALCIELAEVEQRLADIAEATKAPLHDLAAAPAPARVNPRS